AWLTAGALAGLVPTGRLRGRRLSRAQRLFHGRVDRVELVIAGHLLDELSADAARGGGVLEHDEVAKQVEEASMLEDALQHHLELGKLRRRILGALDGAPGLEPFPASTERADPRLHAVGGEEHRVG